MQLQESLTRLIASIKAQAVLASQATGLTRLRLTRRYKKRLTPQLTATLFGYLEKLEELASTQAEQLAQAQASLARADGFHIPERLSPTLHYCKPCREYFHPDETMCHAREYIWGSASERSPHTHYTGHNLAAHGVKA